MQELFPSLTCAPSSDLFPSTACPSCRKSQRGSPINTQVLDITHTTVLVLITSPILKLSSCQHCRAKMLSVAEVAWIIRAPNGDGSREVRVTPVTSSDAHSLFPRFNQCYGVLGVLDYLHGTDTVFRQTKAYERHRVLLSLTPLSQSIPDAPRRAEWAKAAARDNDLCQTVFALGPKLLFTHSRAQSWP